MGIEKTRLPLNVFIYRVNMNTNIDEMIKNCSTCLDFQASKDNTM